MTFSPRQLVSLLAPSSTALRRSHHLTRAIAILIAIGLWVPSAVGQAGRYTVTATLNPVWHSWWSDSYMVYQREGLTRGADGALYGMAKTSSGEGGAYAILRVSPTTGQAQVVDGNEVECCWPPELLPGYDGRLYYVVREEPGCGFGCVSYVDTANHGRLEVLYDFSYTWDDLGVEAHYPDYVWMEDTDGAVYVDFSVYYDETPCPDGSWADGATLRISREGVPEVVERRDRHGKPCGPPFDWSSVTASDHTWHFSDGKSYYAASGGLYQYDALTQTRVRLIDVPATDGQPLSPVAEASGYIYGVTCCGGALNGGVVFRVRVPSLASPDLVITSLSAPPPAAAPSESFSVTDTTHNDGPEPAATSVTSYYLSLTGDKADVKLSGNRYLPELPTGADSTGPRTVKVPSTAPVGTYWLIACADATGNVPEGDEANNCRSADTQVTVGRPDLRESAVSTASSFASPGAKVTISDTVENPGIVTAPASTTRYYLSLDSAKGAGDVLLAGKRAVPELTPGAVSADSASVTIPVSTPSGTYYVLACADDLVKIKETSEANNCAASASVMLVGWPDLVTTAVSNPPTDAALGGKFTMTDTVLNQGNVPADASKSRYYLSLNTTKDGADVLLTGTRSVVSLAPGATSTGSKLVTVPLNAAPGTYYVLACADDLLKAGESNEANNCRASATTVIIHP